ncbi:hypothetical protein KSF81_27320 [Siccirubricoccus sp. G192]|nr:hypothetical protein [Siccirubricoccus sp. G192]
MRIQHVAQAAKGWSADTPEEREDGARLADAVERIRWRLWHGQVRRALDLIGETLAWLEGMPDAELAAAAKVAALLRGLETYVAGQAGLIIDYATARRSDEPISTATTESTVQWLLHRRMGANPQGSPHSGLTLGDMNEPGGWCLVAGKNRAEPMLVLF